MYFMSNLYSKDNMRYDESFTIRKRHDHKAESNEEFVSDVFFQINHNKRINTGKHNIFTKSS